MYTSHNFQIRDEETFSLCIPTDRDYKILQLTDLHLGFGMFSWKKDRLALGAGPPDGTGSDRPDRGFRVPVFPQKRDDE